MNGAIPKAFKDLEAKVAQLERLHRSAVETAETSTRFFQKEIAHTRTLERAIESYEAQLAFIERRLGPAKWLELVQAYEAVHAEALRIVEGGGA